MRRSVMSVEDALARADLWRLLALSFSCPDAELLESAREIAAGLLEGLVERGDNLSPLTADLGDALAKVEARALEHEYHALFATNVLIPPYEGDYHRAERGTVIGDIAAFFSAFGLSTEGRPPDSLASELGLMAWLSLKAAYALEHGKDEELAVTLDAKASFLRDHLARWQGAFCDRLFATTGNPVYVAAANLLGAVTQISVSDLNVEDVRPLELGGTPTDVEDDIACAGCSDEA